MKTKVPRKAKPAHCAPAEKGPPAPSYDALSLSPERVEEGAFIKTELLESILARADNAGTRPLHWGINE